MHISQHVEQIAAVFVKIPVVELGIRNCLGSRVQVVVDDPGQNDQIWFLRWEIPWTVDSHKKWSLADIDGHWDSVLIQHWRTLLQYKPRIKLLDLIHLISSPLLGLLLHSVSWVLHMDILLGVLWDTAILVGCVLLLLLVVHFFSQNPLKN